jgi:amino acid adenylation domain-containing protein
LWQHSDFSDLDGTDMLVHELVEAQAKATPAQTAVVDGGKRISYRELDARSNQLAHFLRSCGIAPEVPVGLCLRRSWEFVTAALGILKAGGAYVPLDPTYPPSRLAMCLTDAEAPVLVTEAQVAGQLPPGSWRTILPDEQRGEISNYSELALHTEMRPENLAYIIFTSGSTGRPKGVQVTHANLLNLVQWHNETFGITRLDKATVHASAGFDASVWEIWPYLASGAVLYVVDDAIRTTPELLRDWIVDTGITLGFLPTPLAELMIDLSWPSETALRILLTGADTLRRRPPANLPFRLVNNYGPTECTVVATSGIVEPDARAEGLPSIGRPITNVRVYIVDQQQRPVPPGVPGELMIGGSGVSRGYLNLPELTGEKFIADPFSGKSEARLYRTGDRACFLPDGQISFLGRLDDQIKIRGYRIEPQEICIALHHHPAIKASYVIASSERDPELIAYVVLQEDCEATSRDLRKFLEDHVPDHMVPSTFVRLTDLPLSPSGKLDVTSLPKPTADNTIPEEIEVPQSPVEQRVAGFLSALFKRPVGRGENFFTMGGHSLMGAQIIARIHDVFDVDLPLLSLFDNPTVKELAAEIERLIYAKVDSMSEEEVQEALASSPIEFTDALPGKGLGPAT